MKKLLIVVDMQNDFIDGSLGTKEAQAIVPKVAEKIRTYKEDGWDVIFTMDTHKEDYLDSLEGKNLPVVHCVKGTNGWALHKEIDKFEGRRFEKETFGCLECGRFASQKGYDQVELVGLVSNICVLTNAVLLKTALPEAEIIVDAACTACADPAMNEKALDVLEGLQITVTNRK